jgi:hypothetical protein
MARVPVAPAETLSPARRLAARLDAAEAEIARLKRAARGHSPRFAAGQG